MTAVYAVMIGAALASAVPGKKRPDEGKHSHGPTTQRRTRAPQTSGKEEGKTMSWLTRALTLPKNRNSLADLSPELAGRLTSDISQVGHFWVGIGKRAAALAQAGNLDGLEQFAADLIAAGQEAVSQPMDLADPLKAERIAGRAFAAKWDIAL